MSKIQMEIRSLPIEMSSNVNDGILSVSGIVNGAGSVSEILTNPRNGRQFRETIAPGVFAQAISNASRIDFLSQHDKTQILSTTDNQSLQLQETEKGLEMRADISSTTWGKDTFQLIKDGIIKGMSFGMRVSDDNWSMGSDGIPMRTINGINLFEISAVRNPAYKSSEIEARDVDIINDIEIPDNIEERSEKLEDKDKEVREETPVTEEVKSEPVAEAKKEGDQVSEAPKKEAEKDEAKETEPEKESVKVEPSEEVRSLIDSLKAEIGSVRSQLEEFRSLVEEKKEQPEVKEEVKEEPKAEERSVEETPEDLEVRSFFVDEK